MTASSLLAACGPSDNAPKAAANAPAQARKVVVGLDDNFPPMGFRDANNQIVGFDIDMAKEASKRLGMEVEFKPIDWSAKEAELNGKRVDVLWNGLTITEERKKNISFTAPYMANHQIIVVGTASPISSRPTWPARSSARRTAAAPPTPSPSDPVAGSIKEVKKFGDNVTALMDPAAGRLTPSSWTKWWVAT